MLRPTEPLIPTSTAPTPVRAPTTTARRAAALAPAVFVFLWSTGFVAARYATDDAGPLTFLALRMGIAAVILLVVALVLRAPRPSRRDAGWAALAGLGMQTIYLGGVFIAIAHGLPTGVSALIAGLHPVITSIVAGAWLGERLRRVQWIGVAIGLGGVVLVVVDHFLADSGDLPPWPLLAAALSVLGMSGGTLVQRRHGAGVSLVWGVVSQYIGAAVVFAIGAVLIEHIDFTVTAQSMFALVWAVGVLSIGAVLILMWLLRHSAAARVSSLFFLTPALSAIEGAILFGERLGPLAVVGLVVSLAGVALVTRA